MNNYNYRTMEMELIQFKHILEVGLEVSLVNSQRSTKQKLLENGNIGSLNIKKMTYIVLGMQLMGTI